MSTIAINTFLTLDGVAQAPGGPSEDTSDGFEHGGWQVPYFTEQLGEIIGPWHTSADGLLLGRRTYDIFAGHWPHVPTDHEDAAMAKVINERRKYVASRTLDTVEWQNSTLLGDDVVDAVEALKKRDLGELVVVGSLDFAQTLIRHKLIDEYRLTIFPVVLGTGKRLFTDGGTPAGLELVSTQTTDAGVIACVYRAAGAPTYGTFAL
jgi:dihydrofolate reductase